MAKDTIGALFELRRDMLITQWEEWRDAQRRDADLQFVDDYFLNEIALYS